MSDVSRDEFDRLVARVDQLEHRHDAAMELIAAELVGLRTHIETTATDVVTQVNGSLGDLEQRVNGSLGDVVTQVNGSLGDLEQRVNGSLGDLEQRVDGSLGRFEQRVNGRLDEIDERAGAQFELHGHLLNRILDHLEPDRADDPDS